MIRINKIFAKDGNVISEAEKVIKKDIRKVEDKKKDKK